MVSLSCKRSGDLIGGKDLLSDKAKRDGYEKYLFFSPVQARGNANGNSSKAYLGYARVPGGQ